MGNKENKLKPLRKYHRETIGCPEGSVVHDGDCYVFDVGVCTCGLLHILLRSSMEVQDMFPKYMEQLELHMERLRTLSDYHRE